jgi:hypothetical protein
VNEDCSYVGAAWNEEVRAAGLLTLMREWFPHLIVAVQESTDRTLEIVRSVANRPGDTVLEHPHFGFGDASFPELLSRVPTRWVFLVSFDEMPSLDLLEAIAPVTAWADDHDVDSFTIPFHSTIEGFDYTNEQDAHVRLFRSELKWQPTLHNEPAGQRRAELRDAGYIQHDRSLDEMIIDYLSYWKVGQGNVGWTTHNRRMMHDACEAIAKEKGWDFVTSYPWWPEVEAIAFR